MVEEKCYYTIALTTKQELTRRKLKSQFEFLCKFKKTKKLHCTFFILHCISFLCTVHTQNCSQPIRIENFFMYIVHFCFFLYISTIQLGNNYKNLGELEVMWKMSPFGLVL